MSSWPVPQAGHVDGNDIEAEIQILAKCLTNDLLLQILVRRGDDPHVHPDRRPSADSVDLALLDRAQQFRLQPAVHLADFVQQDRAVLRRLQLADALPMCAGECAAFMPEQFGFKQLLGNRRAVDRDERAVRPAASCGGYSGR